MVETLDDSATPTTTDNTSRQNMAAAVLQGAPALSNHNDATAGATTLDLGQLGHGLNESGIGSWPYIVSVDLNADTVVSYGSDSVTVTYGNTDSSTGISITNENPADSTQVHITITDPALNIDPTTADVWDFGSGASSSSILTYFANNGSDTVMSVANMGELDFAANGFWAADVTTSIEANTGDISGAALTAVTFTETGANTGVFESFDATGASEVITQESAGADGITIFSYGGNSASMIITYNDASVTMGEAGQTWDPATAVTISVNDPDANKNPTSAETLAIGNELNVIPTIKVGSPLTLAQSGTNDKIAKNDGANTGGVTVGSGTGDTRVLLITNTTDNSERLRIILSSEVYTEAALTHTWINVTTGHTRDTIVELQGTVVLNYDVTGPCALLTCTAVDVYVTASGSNTTNEAGISVNVSAGNDQEGVYDLDDGTRYITGDDVHGTAGTNVSLFGNHAAATGAGFVGVAFKMTHAAGNDLSSDADFAIAADFCNFDQNNSSLVHNCIYRLEAVETGANTGILRAL
jgi:hypothetical protein